MSRRSRERANSRPWEQEQDDDQTEHDDTERCPNTGDMFEDEQDDGSSN